MVPRKLLERQKRGFTPPTSDWFRGPLKEKMLDDSDLYEMKVCGNCGMIATRKKVMNKMSVGFGRMRPSLW